MRVQVCGHLTNNRPGEVTVEPIDKNGFEDGSFKDDVGLASAAVARVRRLAGRCRGRGGPCRASGLAGSVARGGELLLQCHKLLLIGLKAIVELLLQISGECSA